MRGALEGGRNGAYRGQRGDGWKAEDKLSFRQRSKMCAGRKTHFVVRGQWTSGLTGRFEGDGEKKGEGMNGERKRGGKGSGRRSVEGEGKEGGSAGS